MTKETFVNLHSHSSASMLDAIIKVPDLFKRVLELGQDTISLTDHGNMGNVWTAYKEYKKYKDAGTPIKFIPGNEIYFCEDLTDKKSKRRHLVLLASNAEGYKNLLRVTAAGFENSVTIMGREFPRVDAEILRKYSDGLIATSACGGSLLAAGIFGGNRDAAKSAAELFRSIYGDRFYIELQPHSMRRGEFSQEYLNDQLKSLAEELKIEMVATCDSHYLTAAHEKYHDMVLAISDKKPLDDPDRHRYTTFEPCIVCAGTGTSSNGGSDICGECLGSKGHQKPCAEFYLKTEQQVFSFFSKRYGVDLARRLIANTRKIADMCEPPDYMEPKGARLPVFDWEREPDAEQFRGWLKTKGTLKNIKSDAAYLRFKAFEGFNKHTEQMSKDDKKIYWARILKELEILEARGFSSYILIVADLISWARANSIMVGAGRGSVGGSVIAFLLGIHKADPIKYGLVFERFHNKEKKSYPDIDSDYSPTGRERVIQYAKDRYGEGHVASISNIMKLTPKLVIKDVARSLNIGGDKSTAFNIANEVTAEIPDVIKDGDKTIKVDTMAKAIGASKRLQTFVQEYPEVLEYAEQLIGLPRSWATHAAGVVISDVKLDEYVPLRRDKEGVVVIQYDKDQCEENGLIKIDFLGLETLDVFQEILEQGKKVGMALPVPNDIQDGDARTYKMIQGGNVAGVFQLSGILGTLCKTFKPESIPDLAAINALGRPSCGKEERTNFINRRFGKAKIEYPHPVLEPVLKRTYGISVYEEDLLFLAQHVAGWDLSEADGLRKLTKLKEKGAALAAELEKKFVRDAHSHSKISNEDALLIWNNVVIPWAGYGFNKCLDQNEIILTSDGEKKIMDVVPGDSVFTISKDGTISGSKVIQRHDNGIVPMWEVDFDDGSTTRCSLEHKWLTEYGQQPLWRILEEDLETFGNDRQNRNEPTNLSRLRPCIIKDLGSKETSETVRSLDCLTKRQRAVSVKDAHNNVWANSANENKGSRAPSTRVPAMLPNKIGDKEADNVSRKQNGWNEEKVVRYSKDNICASRCGSVALRTATKMEGRQPRSISENNGVGTKSSKEIENGDLVGAVLERNGVQAKCQDEMREGSKVGRFCEQAEEDRDRNRWTVALFSGSWTRGSGKDTDEGYSAGYGDRTSPDVELDKARHVQLQSIRRVQELNLARHYEFNKRQETGGLKGRKVVRIKYIGLKQAFDLEVDHNEHNFLLANGLCSSNSHAILYSMISYQTAYYKAHAPGPFFCAMLNSETKGNTKDKAENLDALKRDAARFKINIEVCDVNISKQYATLKDKTTIVTGLGTIKGLGEKALEAIIVNQPYSSFEDFLHRTPSSSVNKGTITALAKAGAFDSFGISRKFAFDHYGTIRTEILAYLKKLPAECFEIDEAGQAIRSEPLPEAMNNFVYSLADKSKEEWDLRTKLTYEKEVLGEYISGSVEVLYPGFFKHGMYGVPFAKIQTLAEGNNFYLEGLISSVKEITIKKAGKNHGKLMAKLVVENLRGEVVDCTVWADMYGKQKKLIKPGVPLRGICKINEFNGSKSLILANLEDIYKEQK